MGQTVDRSGETNGLAIASLVLGILGLTAVPLLASIVAVFVGYRAQRQMDVSGEGGRTLATAGIVLGWIGIAVAVLGIVVVVLVLAVAGAVFFEGWAPLVAFWGR